MKKQVMIVPKGECPLDFLAKMGEAQTKNAWVFINQAAADDLINGADDTNQWHGYIGLSWKKTLQNSETYVALETSEFPQPWYQLYNVLAEDIPFTAYKECKDPDDIIFLAME